MGGTEREIETEQEVFSDLDARWPKRRSPGKMQNHDPRRGGDRIPRGIGPKIRRHALSRVQ